MKSCQKCGFSNEDNAKYCKNCGQEFTDTSRNQNCKQCGKPIIPGTRFCKHCGSIVESRKESVPEVKKIEKIEQKKASSKSDSGILAIAAIVIVVLIAVIVVISQKPSGNDYNSDDQNYVDSNNYNDDIYEDESIYEQDESDHQDMNEEEDSYDNSTDEQEDEAKDYILEGSDSRYLTKADLAGLTAEECRLARNEIYARHGRMFKDEALQEYFESFDWYYPTIQADDFEESMLNEYEIANRDLIVEYESEQGYR